MNITEELDKIIDKHKVDVSYVGRLESFKIEILALFERKMNEVVPEFRERYEYAKAIYTMQQNIKKVLEGE